MNYKENKLILYKDDEGKVSVNVRFVDEDVWLTQLQLASIYDTTKQNISQHIQGILSDGELDEEATVKKFLTVHFGNSLTTAWFSLSNRVMERRDIAV